MNTNSIQPQGSTKSGTQTVPEMSAGGRNLLETAAARDEFKTFSKALDAAGMGDTLRSAGPYTLFAPTDAAFAKLPSGKLDSLMKPENRKELISVLNYHIVAGSKNAAELGKMSKTTTLAGRDAPIAFSGSQLSFDGAQVTTADIGSSNGVLHAIDRVNLPAASSVKH